MNDDFEISGSLLKGMANAIRERNKTTEKIFVEDFEDKIKEVPFGMLDTSQITDWSNYCSGGKRINTISSLDTSNGKLFDSFCSSAKGLTEVANFDTSKAESLAYCFNECSALQNAPILNTSACKNFSFMYYKCSELKDGGIYDMTSIENATAEPSASYMFAGCDKLEKLKIKIDEIKTSNMVRMFLLNTATETFTDFEIEVVAENGGIKVDDNSFNLSYHEGLSVESLLSVLNALQDNTDESTMYSVYLGDNLAKLTAVQKQIAYSKNINLK